MSTASKCELYTLYKSPLSAVFENYFRHLDVSLVKLLYIEAISRRVVIRWLFQLLLVFLKIKSRDGR